MPVNHQFSAKRGRANIRPASFSKRGRANFQGPAGVPTDRRARTRPWATHLKAERARTLADEVTREFYETKPLRTKQVSGKDVILHNYRAALLSGERNRVGLYDPQFGRCDVLTPAYLKERTYKALYEAYPWGVKLPKARFSLALVDFDYLKKMNDADASHHMGDKALAAMVGELRKITEKYGGILGRGWKGDEFKLFVPIREKTLMTELKKANERLGKRLIRFNKKETRGLSFSAGIHGSENLKSASVHRILRELNTSADSAMYRGKRKGRGRVTIFRQ
jgi:diguanylate cyclase (GGDEF)-like protein